MPPHAASPITVRTIVRISNTVRDTHLDAPTVTAFAPVRGPATGGSAVSVTGTGVVDGATRVPIGDIISSPPTRTVTDSRELVSSGRDA
jgi:hypothetical protein